MAPLLASKITIKKERTLTPDSILKILADVTEQPVQRPQNIKKLKNSYSGNRKMTTMQAEIVMEEHGSIRSISKSHRSRIHDCRIGKQARFLPTASIKHADAGYQGW